MRAVDRYTDIPEAVRERLKQRIGTRQYDDVATITRDAVQGKRRYQPELRDMHFGGGRVCRSVTRNRWPDGAQERGLVYCDSGQCLIVPTVCRNVSRITSMPAGDTGQDHRAIAADPAALLRSALQRLPELPSGETFDNASEAAGERVVLAAVVPAVGTPAARDDISLADSTVDVPAPTRYVNLGPALRGDSSTPVFTGPPRPFDTVPSPVSRGQTMGGPTTLVGISGTVPELPAAWLLLAGGCGLLWRARRRAGTEPPVRP